MHDSGQIMHGSLLHVIASKNLSVLCIEFFYINFLICQILHLMVKYREKLVWFVQLFCHHR